MIMYLTHSNMITQETYTNYTLDKHMNNIVQICVFKIQWVHTKVRFYVLCIHCCVHLFHSLVLCRFEQI